MKVLYYCTRFTHRWICSDCFLGRWRQSGIISDTFDQTGVRIFCCNVSQLTVSDRQTGRSIRRELKCHKVILFASTQTTGLNSTYYRLQQLESNTNTRKLPVLFKHRPVSPSFASVTERRSDFHWSNSLLHLEEMDKSTIIIYFSLIQSVSSQSNTGVFLILLHAHTMKRTINSVSFPLPAALLCLFCWLIFTTWDWFIG